jgi:hypothetical protein
MKRRILIRVGLFFVLAIVGLATYFLFRIGPRNVWGMLVYDQRREGDLEVGKIAPDVELTALDGSTKVKLKSRLKGRPLVLIFGSYT